MSLRTASAVAAPDVRGLRVLEFCDYYGPDSLGGSERVAREVNRVLVALGASVTVATAYGGSPYADDGIPVVRRRAFDLTRALGAQLTVSPGYAGWARQLVARLRPDVLYTHSLHFQGSLAAAVAGRRTRTPLVTVAHVGGLDALRGRARAMAELHERTVGRFVLRSSAEVIAVGDAVAEHARRRGARGSVTVATNGVDHAQFRPSGAWSGCPTVLFVGRLVDNKGVRVLLDAARLLWARGHQFRVVVVGDGPLGDVLSPECRHAGEAVEFVGRSRDVAAWMARATVVVRPSFTEGMPLTVLEAMAARRCVVLSDIPPHTAMVQHLQNGMLHRTGDAADLAAALARVLHDSGLRERLADAGCAWAAEHTWAACANTHASVLARAAAARARA